MGAEEFLEGCGAQLLWFDSLGAKSSSLVLRGPDCGVAVDPGAASMQPSYPLGEGEKRRLRGEALARIRGALSSPDVKAVIITHYHHDHYPWPGNRELPPQALLGKTVVAKNPNTFINRSQWRRAREFFEALASASGLERGGIYVPPGDAPIQDPEDLIPSAMGKDFGGYAGRREAVLRRGREWFRRLRTLWGSGDWVREFSGGDGTRVVWADGRVVEVCGIRLSFTEPWFHGMEYDRTGWVIGFLAEVCGCRIGYSSDVMGPIIEDYAERIAGWGADIVVLDGPPTYLYPYLLSGASLRRAVENAVKVVESGPRLIIYDHHLLRDPRWRERVSEVLAEAGKRGVAVMTAAEAMGREPLIDALGRGS